MREALSQQIGVAIRAVNDVTGSLTMRPHSVRAAIVCQMCQ